MRTRALLAAAALFAACQPAAQGRRLTLGVSALRISLPVFVAIEQGIFARHGLTIEPRVYETAQPMVEEIADGRIDAGGYAAYPIVLLGARGARFAPVVATTLVEDSTHRLSYVLGRPGKGLAFPRDVRGRTIGILPTAAYQRWLRALLVAAGVEPTQVTVIPVAPALQAQTLAEGGVDFLFTNDPMATSILARGLGEIADDGPPCAKRLGDPFDFGTFVLSGRLVGERPDVARRLVAAIDEAIARTERDPPGAIRAMARFTPPEQHTLASRYPPARFLPSAEVPAARLASEIARERRYGILTEEARVEPWSSH